MSEEDEPHPPPPLLEPLSSPSSSAVPESEAEDAPHPLESEAAPSVRVVRPDPQRKIRG